MTKILVVDDEQPMARGLSRAILLRRPEYAVSICHSGAEAITRLSEESFDLVITDLQMVGGDGFELLAWLLSHRPSVLAFAMSGFCDDEAHARLSALGSVECFAKPLDVNSLLLRFTECITQSMRGHVSNIGLASFLQLVEMEQKTCTLEVRSDGRVGRLFLRKGELLDAQAGELSGEEAACAIIGWMSVDLTIEGSCNNTRRTIWKPAHYVVMEAMRLCDEAGKKSTRASRPAGDLLFETFPEWSTREQRGLLPAAPPARGRLDSLHIPVGALALVVVDRATGLVVASEARIELDILEVAQGAAAILKQESATVSHAAGDREGLQEIVFMTGGRGELLRPMPSGEQFVMLIFDASETNLVMARHELERFVREYTITPQP